MGHLANRAWWSSHAIITVEHNQSGARLCDLAEHADAWHGEVFAQSYLHGLNRPEAKDPTLIGAHKLSPKLKSHKLVDLAQAAGIFHPLDQATLESTRSCVRGLHAVFARIEKALPRRRMWLKFGALVRLDDTRWQPAVRPSLESTAGLGAIREEHEEAILIATALAAS